MVPIPGTKRRDRLAENLGAVDVTLDETELARLEAVLPARAWSGQRPKFLVAGPSRPRI